MPKNVLVSLRNREYSNAYQYRENLANVQRLVLKKDSGFKKIWEKSSEHPILYEGNRIYFDHYRSCYTIYGNHGLPSLLYQLPPVPKSQKIEEGLICQAPLSNIDLPNKGYRPAFLAVTAANWLHRYDLQTGELLEKVYISAKYRFRHLSWETDNYTIVVKSVQVKQSQIRRQAGQIPHGILLCLVVMDVFPLEFKAILEIDKSVFGNSIVDAMLSQGILITMYTGGVVKLYSFDWILKQASQENANTDHYPDGLLCNIKLKECPPVMFEVKCQSHNLQLGGIPWHYVMSPPGKQGLFKVYSLETEQLARNGTLCMDSGSVEPDKLLFHADESGRILHIGASEIRVLKVSEELTGTSLQECFKIKMDVNSVCRNGISLQCQSDDQFSGMTFTSSGRLVKRRITREYNEDIQQQVIQGTDYENELDLLWVVGAYPMTETDSYYGQVCLFNNLTGQKLKEIPLEGSWSEFGDHTIQVDLDAIVHIVKCPARKYYCEVYKLTDSVMQEDHTEFKKKTRRHSRKSEVR